MGAVQKDDNFGDPVQVYEGDVTDKAEFTCLTVPGADDGNQQEKSSQNDGKLE